MNLRNAQATVEIVRTKTKKPWRRAGERESLNNFPGRAKCSICERCRSEKGSMERVTAD